VIIDADISNVNKPGCAHQVIKKFPDVKVVVLAEHSCAEFVRTMFDSGIRGYILKGFLFQELISAVNIVLKGGIYLSPAIKDVQMNIYAENREV
jgi:two-component system response regulator DegU